MKKTPTLLSFIKKYAWQYLLGMLCLLAVDYMELFIPQLTGEIVDGLTIGSFTGRMLLTDALIIIAVAAVVSALRLGWRVLIFGSSRRAERDIRESLYHKLTLLPHSFYQTEKTGDLMSYFTNDMDAVRMAIGPAVLEVFDAVVQTVLVLAKMIIYVDLRLTCLAVIPMVILLLTAERYGKAMKRRAEKKQQAFSLLSNRVQESISGIRVIKAFVQEEAERRSFAEVNRSTKEANLKVVRLKAIFNPFLNCSLGLSVALTLLYGGYLVINGRITLGSFVAFNSYVTTLVWPMMAAGDAVTTVSQGSASWKRIREIFSQPETVIDDELTDNSIDTIGGDIKFNDLHFRYSPSLPEVLSGFDACIPKGSTVGILGATGSGKSTIVSLLSRVYDPEPGSIFIGGHDIRSIPLAVLREGIAVVPQENLLFSDTIQSNIAFGTRTIDKAPPEEKEKFRVFITDAQAAEQWVEQELAQRESKTDQSWNDLGAVKEAAMAADVHDNIMDFPKGYGTVVGERGVTLSGGQKQRTAIARAFMKDAEILILDDALSAVDTDTEARILSRMKELRKGRTTILIAHRITTLEHADLILYLEDGKCRESGSHSQLLALGGRYARLYEQQQLELQLRAEREALHDQD